MWRGTRVQVGRRMRRLLSAAYFLAQAAELVLISRAFHRNMGIRSYRDYSQRADLANRLVGSLPQRLVDLWSALPF